MKKRAPRRDHLSSFVSQCFVHCVLKSRLVIFVSLDESVLFLLLVLRAVVDSGRFFSSGPGLSFWRFELQAGLSGVVRRVLSCPGGDF